MFLYILIQRTLNLNIPFFFSNLEILGSTVDSFGSTLKDHVPQKARGNKSIKCSSRYQVCPGSPNSRQGVLVIL